VITLRHPDSPQLWNIARRLVEEYAGSLDVDLSFQDFGRELTHLEVEYSAPAGRFLLAEDEGAFVGCGAIRRFSESACEMKRLYVSSRAQGRGVGRLLAAALIDEARALGYQAMLLDTLPSMHGAQQLYRSLGFKPVTPYRFNPVPGTIFLQLDL
jgi:GNAT superfamily N-acetyltransferase